nr:phage tail protein [Gilliamella bombi]
MSQTYYTILTKLGAELLANATALGVPLKLTSIAVGDGNGSIPKPTATQTALVNEVRRAAINVLSVDKNNPNQIIAEQVIPETEGGWFIHEVGLYDDKGNLIAVGNCPSTYKPKLAEGSGRTQIIRMIIVVDNVDSVAIKIDPSVVLATREYVDKGIKKRVPITRKINNKELKQDIVLNAVDINALPALKKMNGHEYIFGVSKQTEFEQRPLLKGSELICLADYKYEINDSVIVLRRADGLIIQCFKAMFLGVDGINGTIASLPIAFPNNFYFAIASDGADGCHTVSASPNTQESVRLFGKVGDIYVDSLLQIIAVGR